MSITVMAAVMKNLGLKPAEKAILGIYASFADDTGGSIYPSHETISLYTSYHRPTVVEVTQELISKGVLVKVGKASRGQNEYRIDLTALTILEVNAPLKHLQAISDKRKTARSRINQAKEPTPTPEPAAPDLSSEVTPEAVQTDHTPPPCNQELQPPVTRDYKGLSSRTTRLMFKHKGLKDKGLKDLNNLSAEQNLSFENEPKPVTDQEPKTPKTTKTDMPKPPNFAEFKAVYDQNAANAKNHPWGVMQIQDLAEVVTRLNTLAVTYQDFENAIVNQDQNPKYGANGPKSYEIRAWNEKNLRVYGHYINPSKYPYNKDGTPKNGDPAGDNKPFTYLVGPEPETDWEPQAAQYKPPQRDPDPIPGSEAYELSTMFSMGISQEDIDAALAAHPDKTVLTIRFKARDERDKRLAQERAEKAAALVEVPVC